MLSSHVRFFFPSPRFFFIDLFFCISLILFFLFHFLSLAGLASLVFLPTLLTYFFSSCFPSTLSLLFTLFVFSNSILLYPRFLSFLPPCTFYFRFPDPSPACERGRMCCRFPPDSAQFARCLERHRCRPECGQVSRGERGR